MYVTEQLCHENRVMYTTLANRAGRAEIHGSNGVLSSPNWPINVTTAYGVHETKNKPISTKIM